MARSCTSRRDQSRERVNWEDAACATAVCGIVTCCQEGEVKDRGARQGVLLGMLSKYFVSSCSEKFRVSRLQPCTSTHKEGCLGW